MANKINDENIVNSLSEKIRNQAQRLRNLMKEIGNEAYSNK